MLQVNANGARIPALGLGTWELRGEVATRLVARALQLGYRHIDTAQMYGNESEVGAALAAAETRRDEIFLTTKIWPDHFAPDRLQRAAEDSLRRLQTDYVDLLLLHWPSSEVPLADTLGALNRVRERGLARHIGISNFTRALTEQAVELSDAPIVVNQVEYHPYLDQSALLKTLRQHDIALTAYSPIARGRVLRDPTLQRIADRHGKNPVQVTLRWLLQQAQVCAIPRTQSEQRLSENMAVFDFTLSDEDMAAIAALAEPNGRIVSPSGVAPDWDRD